VNRSKVADALLAAQGYVVDKSSPAYTEELIRMYAEGKRVVDIACDLGVSPSHVSKVAAANGLTRRKGKAK